MADGDNQKITKRSVGAPTVVTPEVEAKLESIFKIGGTIAEACSYAGIGERTYYDRKRASQEFSHKMEAAKHFSDIAAKNVVIKSITEDKDLSSAKWWLEKREFKNSPTVSISGEKVLVIPSTLADKYDLNGVSQNPGTSSPGQEPV